MSLSVSGAKQKIGQAVRGRADEIKDIALKIHRNPELGFEEFQALAWQKDFLESRGFSLQSPFAGLATAYRAETGGGRPVIAFLAEYDALKGLGHACGHNLIAASALGAGAALAEVIRAENIPGAVVILGTPAEEGGGGKVVMVENGCMDGIDMTIMAHPTNSTADLIGSTGVYHLTVTYTGQAAHAASAPHQGRNALDAVRLLFAGVDAWRQQLPDDCRVHGVITHGGDAPNIIPDKASGYFYLRSLNNEQLEKMYKRFQDIIRGAALMTDTEFDFQRQGRPFKAFKPNKALNAAMLGEAEALGFKAVRARRPIMGSTDYGDVSLKAPSANLWFDITNDPKIGNHSPEFERAAGSDFALAQTLKAAEVLAVIGYRYLTEPDFREEVKRDFGI